MPNEAFNKRSLHSKKIVLVLFHNDLRVHDNATLVKAAQLAHDSSNHDGRLILTYVPTLATAIRKKAWEQPYYFDKKGWASQRFLAESLADLDRSLQLLGNRLLYIPRATPFKASSSPLQAVQADKGDAFSLLCELIEAHYVTDICISQTADYAQIKAYEALQDKYPQIEWHSQTTATLFAKLPTENVPKSFTQFRKIIEATHNLLTALQDLDSCRMLTALPPMPESLSHSKVYFYQNQVFEQASDSYLQIASDFKGGESAALIHLEKYFTGEAPSTYKSTRNAMDEWTHSTKFSPWLANGSLSVNVLLNRLRHYEREVIANDSTYWIWFELLWREYFYWYAIEHQERLFLFQGISNHKPDTDHDEQRLKAWQTGETSYPIVNACMQQLNQTGYMSNRSRQLVASAFIHELRLDWRYGATYFEQQLIDYDVASNWGNWQYLAGVGADPRGCRQFNLSKQTQQHDPDGSFREKWLP